MKKQFFFALAALAFTACTAKAVEPNYNVKVALNEDDDDLMAYIIDFDNSQKIDSCIVTDGVASFSGFIAEPRLARIIVDGNRRGQLILEPATIEVNRSQVIGGELNATMDKINNELGKLSMEFNALPDSLKESQIPTFMERENKIMTSFMTENLNNPVGYYLALQKAYDLSLDELNALIAANPSLGEYKRIKGLQDGKIRKAETSAGKPFKDFTVEYNGNKEIFSNYVGKGKHTLVDFWASWCGPCIRETSTIKEIYKEYGPDGKNVLDVLGVAVWDEPANTLKAIEKYQLPWKSIINAQTIPTDIYGIPAIPCIILFDPDGTIIFRDLQGQELKDAVKAALETENK